MNKAQNLLLMRSLRGIWVGFLVLFSILAVYFLMPIVYPFVIGWVIAYLLNPLVNILQRKAKLPRWLATSFSLLLFLAGVGVAVTLLANKIILEIGRFATLIEENIDDWIHVFIDFLNSDKIQDFLLKLNNFYTQNEQVTQTIDQNLDSAGEKLASAISSVINTTVNGIIGFVTALPSVTFILIIALLGAFFMSKDWYLWTKRIGCLFPDKINRSFGTVWAELKRALFGFVRAQIIMISITAIFVTIGLILLGVPYAITIGLVIGLVDLLPYLGTGAAMIPWIIYVFIQGDVALGFGLLLLYGIVFVTRSMIEPKVLAFSIGMDALSTLISMVIGLHFFGALGIIIGPVTLVVLLTLYRTKVFLDIRDYVLGKPSPDVSATTLTERKAEEAAPVSPRSPEHSTNV